MSATDTPARYEQPQPSRWRSLAGWIIALGLFIWGMWSFPVALLGPQGTLIPGDEGDARFNNHILEHFHQYASGRVDHYWDAPMMYPWPNIIAHSDNLLGTAPIYHLFRTLGWSRESAFQLWILVLFALNYWCCLIALRAWTSETALAATGAFIFAFGIHQIGHLYHAQVFPRFMVPLAFFAFWHWLSKGGVVALGLAILAVVYQFYCGIYLGFMLAYALTMLAIGHVIAHRGGGAWARFREPKRLLAWAGSLIAGLLLLLPLMLPYMEVSRSLGMREFHEVEASLPRPVSYFFTHPAAISWQDLSHHSRFTFPEWWHHFHFVGALPWAALAAILITLLLRRAPLSQRRTLAAVSIAFALSMILWLNFGGFTLYRIVYKLPGFSALRSLDRIINIQVMFFAILFVLGAGLFIRRRVAAWSLALLLPCVAALENQVDVGWTKRFDKHEARKRVDHVARHLTLRMPEDASAVAYCPVREPMSEEVSHWRTIVVNIDAILAAQQVGLPVVNAYTGSYPGNYLHFFDHMDAATLADWCRFAGCDTARIHRASNIPMPVKSTGHVHLSTPDGRYLMTDADGQGRLLAVTERPSLWETFTAIHLADGRVALLAHNERFVRAAVLADGAVQAAAKDLGDHGLFTLTPAADSTWSLRAHGGRPVVLDADSRSLVAVADTTVAPTPLRVSRTQAW